jgi:hypothetical protein
MSHAASTTHTARRRGWLRVSALLLLILLLAEPTLALRGAAPGDLAPVAYLPLLTNEHSSSQPAATPTATSTATPTATNTATPTTTASTAPCSYVYPIGVDASLLDANGFLPPADPGQSTYYVRYSDGYYTNKTQRRLYNIFPTDFVFLAWQGSTNAITFSASLSGTGTLDQGFDEVVPWPDPNSLSPGGYPLLPHQLNPGDWLSATSGGINGTLMFAALEQHVVRRSVLALPIYDQLVTSGTTISVHMAHMGAFLLNGFYQGGSKSYLDLAYLGPAESSFCTSAITPTPLPPSSVTPSFATMTPTPTASPTSTATATSTPTNTPTSTATSTPTPTNTPTPTFNGTVVPATLSLQITNFYYASANGSAIRPISLRATVVRDGQAFNGALVAGTVTRGTTVFPVTLVSIGGGVYIGCNLGSLTGTGSTPSVSLTASDGQGNTASASSSATTSTKFANCP